MKINNEQEFFEMCNAITEFKKVKAAKLEEEIKSTAKKAEDILKKYIEQYGTIFQKRHSIYKINKIWTDDLTLRITYDSLDSWDSFFFFQENYPWNQNFEDLNPVNEIDYFLNYFGLPVIDDETKSTYIERFEKMHLTLTKVNWEINNKDAN